MNKADSYAAQLIEFVRHNGGDVQRLAHDADYMMECARAKAQADMRFYDELSERFSENPSKVKAELGIAA